MIKKIELSKRFTIWLFWINHYSELGVAWKTIEQTADGPKKIRRALYIKTEFVSNIRWKIKNRHKRFRNV